MKYSLVISNFIKTSLVFPVLLFYSIFLHCSFKKAFWSLLAIVWNCAFRWVYLCLSPLPFASLLCSLICKASTGNHFTSSISFSWRWFWSLPPVQCYKSLSIVLQALYPPNPIPWVYSSSPLSKYRGISLGSYLNGLVVFPTFFNWSLNFAIKSSWSESQSAPGLVFADCIQLLHLWLQRA